MTDITPLQQDCLHLIEGNLKTRPEFKGRTWLMPSWVMAHIQIESSWRVDVLSVDGFGSIGLMQCLPATAHSMGVMASQAIPENSILAGMRYMVHCYDFIKARLEDFHAPEDVVEAFNEGEGNVVKGRDDEPYLLKWRAAQARWAWVDKVMPDATPGPAPVNRAPAPPGSLLARLGGAITGTFGDAVADAADTFTDLGTDVSSVVRDQQPGDAKPVRRRNRKETA